VCPARGPVRAPVLVKVAALSSGLTNNVSARAASAASNRMMFIECGFIPISRKSILVVRAGL
jgi:hypothetical protein